MSRICLFFFFYSGGRSFFSVQFKEDTTVAYGETLTFDEIITNFGNNYIALGGIYMYV